MGRRFSAGMEFCQFPSRFSRSDGRGRPSHIVARASPPAVPALKLKRRPFIKTSLPIRQGFVGQAGTGCSTCQAKLDALNTY